MDEKQLFEGKSIVRERPVRHRLFKERCSLEEYPFDAFPPVTLSNSFLLSREIVQHFAIVGPFIEFIGEEDIFLTIMAYRLGLTSRENTNFFYTKPKYNRNLYRNCLVLHSGGDIQANIRIWNDQIVYMAQLKVIPNEYVAQLLVPSPVWDVS